MKDLSINFVGYEHFRGLSKTKKVNLIIDSIKNKDILVTEGHLDPSDELALIEGVMRKIGKDFKGIEICRLSKNESYYSKASIFTKFKRTLLTFLGGRESGLTIIGPAVIISQIKKNPQKVSFKFK